MLTFDGPAPRPLDDSLIQRFEFAWCAEIFDGPVCELNESTAPTVWVQTKPRTSLTVLKDGRPVDVTWVPIQGGLRATVPNLFGANAVAVRAEQDEPSTVDTHRLPLRSKPRPAPLAHASELIVQNATTAAAAFLRTVEIPAGDIRFKSEIETLRAKVALRGLHFNKAALHWLQAAELAVQEGLREKPFRDLGPAAYVSILLNSDAPLARKVLATMRSLPKTDYGRVLIDLYEGYFARRTSDLRRADRRLSRAESAGRRLRMVIAANGAANERAYILTLLGHHAEAFRVFGERPSTALGKCDQGHVYNNRAWSGAMARDVGVDPPFSPADNAERALEILQQCGMVFQISNVLMTLALAKIQDSDIEGALQLVERTQATERESGSQLPLDARLWLFEIMAQAALLEGRLDDALRAYDDLDALATRRDLPSGRWRAATGRARVCTAQDDIRCALSAYAEAERRLDSENAQALFPASLALLTRPQTRASRRYASLLLKIGRPAEAVNVLYRQDRRQLRGIARAERVRALPPEQLRAWEDAALEYARQRNKSDKLDNEQWGQTPQTRSQTLLELVEAQAKAREALDAALSSLGRDAPLPPNLPPPGPGELILGFYVLEDGLWLGFGLDADGLVTASFREDTPLQDLLQPFADKIRACDQIRIAARDRLANVDFHALSFDGGPIIEGRRVVYTLSAPHNPPQPYGRTALVVADTDGTLPQARDEGRTVTTQLRSMGYRAGLLSGSDIQRSSLIEALHVDLLHWAGHSRQIDTTPDGLGSSVLPLGPKAYLTAGDVLALPRVPRRVVLAGCETGPVDASHLGVAQAFVLAGAQSVIATSRPVRDADARVIGEAIHSGSHVKLSEALRQAQLTHRKTVSDWAAFRTIVP